MYPNFEKFSLLDSKPSITSSGVNYYHVVETWKCLDCKYVGDNTEFIYKNRVIGFTKNTSTTEITTHCPECDSQNILMPDKPQFGIQHE